MLTSAVCQGENQCLIQDLKLLNDIAKAKPHAANAAFTHCFVHKFSFLCRMVINLDSLLCLLEVCIRSILLPFLTGRAPLNDAVRDLITLPARLGGLSIINPTKLNQSGFHALTLISTPLAILSTAQCQGYSYDCNEAQITAKRRQTIYDEI